MGLNLIIYRIKIIYTRTKYRKMGKQLINLKKTSSDLPRMRSTLIILLLFAIFIVIVSFFSKNHSFGVPWFILLVLQAIYRKYMEYSLKKSLLNNGIWIGMRLINWRTVKSYKWMGTKEGLSTLKIEYFEYYSFHTTILTVINEQKEEVDGLFKNMITV